MSADILVVYALLIVALVLFSIEQVRVDLTALLIMALLMLSGVLDPGAALSGFSNIATITVAAMFVLSAGLRQTGALEAFGHFFTRVGERDERVGVAVMMVTVGIVSAFINNTAAVAIFIPIALHLARDLRLSPSKLLMPLSFASMLGGVCTLIGTSTNLIVSAIAADHGVEPFGMFEFAPLGIVLFIAGFAYLILVGIRAIPDRRETEDLTDAFELQPYLTELVLDDRAGVLGQPLAENDITRDFDVDILELYRDGEPHSGIQKQRTLRSGDVLRIRASADEIARLLRRPGVRLLPTRPLADEELETERDLLVEAVIAADTRLVGERIGELDFPERFGAQVLAMRRRGRLRQAHLDDVRLLGGTSLLLKIDRDRLEKMQHAEHFVVVSEVIVPRVRRTKMPIALATMAGVVALAAFGVVPIVVSAVAGCLVMVATGCLDAEEAYEAINWKIVFLLAGILSLGVAMETSGAAQQLADVLLTVSEPYGPTAVTAAFFVLAMALTSVISNNAAAALLAPIAISAAAGLGVSSRPLLVAVTFAASLSFITPIGYQTNTLVYGPGQYRFTDFTRIGAPLNLIALVLAVLLIPTIWPY